MASILIAGCGYVGSALARLIAADGRRVYGLKRSPERLPDGVEPVQADLNDPASLQDLPKDVTQLVYCASAQGPGEDNYRRAYVDGLRNILDAVAEQGVALERIVFTSSTAVYGQDDGEWVDEDSPTDPARYTGSIMLEAEALALNGPARGVVLRLGGIYGPGRDRMVRSVADGSAVVSLGSPQYLNHQHRDDCAGALRHLLALSSPMPIYLGTDNLPEDRGLMLDWVADQLGVDRPKRLPPEEMPRRRQGGNKRCRNDRLRSSGYQFAYPTYREGYADLIGHLR